MTPIVPSDEVRPLAIEHLKTRAKELRRGLQNGDPAALHRFRTLHPKSRGLSDAQIVGRLAKVTEAQLVVAREIGLPSWPQLRRHVARHAAARAEIAAGARVCDGEMPTTHVRCGTDIGRGLELAGLLGTFVEVSDSYCQGPVPRDGDLREIRAQFIAEAYELPIDAARADLLRMERDLERTIGSERVVLWFEHDSFDQLILARILAYYTEHGTPRHLELVHASHFPAVERFHGLGELSAAALRMLWDDRVAVTPALLALGSRVWTALREPSPLTLHEAAQSSEALPQMGVALVRHLQELPWRGDGLSLTERLILQLVAEHASPAGDVFARLTMEREPLVHLGDTMFWMILRNMQRAAVPPIDIAEVKGAQRWHRHRVTITETGRRLLATELDWLECAPPERWVGGVRIVPGSPNWRWDPSTMKPRWT